jgi:hypothetical protein
MTNQQRVDAQRYGYDTRFNAALLNNDTKNRLGDQNNDTKNRLGDQTDDTKKTLAAILDATKNRLGDQTNDLRAQIGRYKDIGEGAVMDTVTGKITQLPRRPAADAASAIPKLPTKVQAQVNTIANSPDLDEMEKSRQLNAILHTALDARGQPLGLVWSYDHRRIERDPLAKPGTAGTVTSSTSAPAGQDATVSKPSVGANTDPTIGPGGIKAAGINKTTGQYVGYDAGGSQVVWGGSQGTN